MLTIFVLFSISSTCASDLDNETLMLHESSLELSVEETSQDLLTENSPGSFVDLKNSIDTSSDTLKLNKSYEFDSDVDTKYVYISGKTLTVDGQGHSIDAKNKSSVFNIRSSNLILKNIVFKNAYGTSNGGAVYSFLSTLKLINCTFSDCYAENYGGAVYSAQGSIDVYNCSFENNYASRGGALYYQYSKTGNISNSTFISNTALMGGAVFIFESTFHNISGCLFENNTALDNKNTHSGGGAVNFQSHGVIVNSTFRSNTASTSSGGAVRWEGVTATYIYGNISNCVFESNNASSSGGAVFMSLGIGSGIYNSQFNNCYAGVNGGAVNLAANYVRGVTVFNSTFTNNRAKNAGAIYWSNYNSTLINSTFENNTASESGGTLYVYQRDVKITGCSFKNSSAKSGGVIYVYQVSSKPSNLKVSDSTFENAEANDGGAVYAYSAAGVEFTGCTFLNTSAERYGGVGYSYKSDIKYSNLTFKNISALYGGALAVYYGSADVSDVRFENVNGATYGGAVYTYLAGLNVSSVIFANISAKYYGGAIYANQATCSIENVSFENLYAGYYGGAIYSDKSKLSIDNGSFINNLAGYYGGALYDKADSLVLKNSVFRGNNASFGSAIFKGNSASAVIDNVNFVYNQADSHTITISRQAMTYKAVFRAKDNILNAIWNNDNADSVIINGSNVVSGANPSKIYQDAREYNQTIIITVLGENDEVLLTREAVTDIYGEVNITVGGGKKVVFTHPEDVFYKYISNYAYVPSFEITKTVLTPEVKLGDKAVFMINVTNTGYIDLANLTVSEDSFEGLVPDFESRTWTVDKLAVNESAVIYVTFNTAEYGIFTNTASVKWENITKSASADVKVYYGGFEALKVCLIPQTVVGNQTIFEIVVYNDGEDDLYDVYVIEDSYEGLIFDHTRNDALWNHEIAGGKHKWTIKQALFANEYAGIFVVFNTTETGNFTNYATAGYSGINHTVNATVEVTDFVEEAEEPVADMNVSIVTVHPLIYLGNQTIFEIVVHNTGNVMLTNVTIEEFDHEGLIFDGFIDASGLWDFKPTTIRSAVKKELLGAPRINNDNSWTVNIPLYVNEYLGFFVVFNSTATGRFENIIFGNSDQTHDKFASDIVDVIHRSENETSGENETQNSQTNENSTAGNVSDNTDRNASKTKQSDDNNSDSVPEAKKQFSKAVSAKVNVNETGNPFLALFVVLTCLILIIRRNG